MKIAIIVNPLSGGINKRRIVEMAQEVFHSAGIQTEFVETRGVGHATILAKQSVEFGCDITVACGGDGTVNEVAQGLIGAPVPLGVIPCGSGNGLARHLGIPMNSRKAVNAILGGHVIPVDSATANGKPFFCTFGMGLDAAVGHRFAKLPKRGFFSYIKSAIAEYRSYAPEKYIIKIGDETIEREAVILSVCNANQYGNNAYIAPRASITDGLLDLTVIRPGNLLSDINLARRLFGKSLHKSKRVETFKATNIEITRSSSCPAHIDGEPIDSDVITTFKVHPGKLNIIVPG